MIQRLVIVIPILMFFELIFGIACLSILFIADGESYNYLNNQGIGNVINAIGFAAGFYVILGYIFTRVITLGLALMVPRNRILVVSIVSASVFGLHSFVFMPSLGLATIGLWSVWFLVVLFNFAAPFALPKKIFG